MFVSQRRDCSLELHLIWADSYAAIMMYLWFVLFFLLEKWSWMVRSVWDADGTNWRRSVTVGHHHTPLRREKTLKDSNGHRGNKKKTGKEQGFRKPFIHLLKLCSVSEQLTRQVDCQLHQNATIHLGSSTLVSKRDSVLHTLFPFAAFQKCSSQTNSVS